MNNHIINSRDNIIFKILENYNENFFKDLHLLDSEMQKKLLKENINYENLKSILSPANKGDIAFIFDWTKINNDLYGDYVLKLLLPFLNDANFCYLHGDYALYNADLEEKKFKIQH